jgi:hypothetical protein
MGEVRERIFLLAEERAQGRRLLVRQLEELVEQAELVHHVEGRRVDGVATKVAQEVGMLLEHDHVDAGTRQQEAEHQAARPASDDAATGGNLLGCHGCALRESAAV